MQECLSRTAIAWDFKVSPQGAPLDALGANKHDHGHLVARSRPSVPVRLS